MKPNKKKLHLVKESLHQLSPQALIQVAGGQAGTTRCVDGTDTTRSTQSDVTGGG